MSSPPRLLILRALGLGDFLTGVPAYRALRAANPEHEIVLAAPGPLASLAALTGAVDQVLPTEEERSARRPHGDQVDPRLLRIGVSDALAGVRSLREFRGPLLSRRNGAPEKPAAGPRAAAASPPRDRG